MTFGNFRWVEALLQWAKRWQYRIYFADHRAQRRRAEGYVGDADAPYELKSIGHSPDPATIKSILVFKPDELGDAVQALPAVRTLKQHFPEAKLCLLCNKGTESFYCTTQIFDEIVAVQIHHFFWRLSFFSISKALSRFSVSNFSVAIFLRTYPKYFRQFKKIPCPIKVHPWDSRLRSRSVYQASVLLWGEKPQHQALQMLQILTPLTGRPYSYTDIQYPDFHWSEADHNGVKQIFSGEIPKEYVVVHPFANFETKAYPQEYWLEVFQGLKQRWNLPIVVVGGPEDGAFPAIEGVIQAQGKLKLTQTGCLLSRSSAFLGNESGPAQWAAALGTPTIVFFGGHSVSSEWAPLGKTLLLTSEVPCSPCHRRVCPGYGVACLRSLMPERVLPEIYRFLAPYLEQSPKELKP